MLNFTLIDFNMTPLQIAGNILTLLGMSLFFISSFFKKKRDIIFLQTGNHSISLIGQILMGQVSGAVQDAVSAVRNVFILLNKNNKYWNIFFIVIGVVLGIVFNVWLFWDDPFLMGIGFLPVVAAFQYSVVILMPNIKVPFIKVSMGFSCVCWTIYGLVSKNYSMALTNTIILIATIISLIQYYINSKNKKENQAIEEEQKPLE